jgi:hypothetical protein
MNSSGKEQLIRKLASVIESVSVKNSGPNIALQWIGNGSSIGNMESNQSLQLGDVKHGSNQEEGVVSKPQLNKRQRKNPALKDEDFLWQI